MDIDLEIEIARMTLHRRIDEHADWEIKMLKLDWARAERHIEEMFDRFKGEDAFRRRSEGQKRRYMNMRKFNKGESK